VVKMNITFRTDASLDIGTGHVMRCLTLAQALREHGASCRFICREHPGNLLDLIRLRGFEAQALPMQDLSQVKSSQQSAPGERILVHAGWLGADWQVDAEQTKDAIGDAVVDWLIVDHYALDVRWEAALKPHYQKLMVIDDLADRPHDCDLLLDQNLGRTEQHYVGLVSAHCTVLVGPQYALLRPDFSKLRQYSLARRVTPQLKRLLITMGGVDKDNATGEVLAALTGSALPTDCHITVVMGPHAPWLTQVRKQAEKMLWSTEVLVNVDNMAKLMADSDLAIGAAGSTSWERCCLGLPTLLVVLADNQRDGANALAKAGGGLLLGNIEDLALNLPRVFESVLEKISLLTLQSLCVSVTNGEGAIYIVNALMNAND
jgi:UDP-2,4-diacetamido-2,4,6-trideoxy-beta-L-altropyranose hydrolase